MEATLIKNDRIIVNELVPDVVADRARRRGGVQGSGRLAERRSPCREQNPVVGFFDWLLSFVGLTAPDSNDHLIKRVIGLPGDTVACCNEFGQMTVNGVPLEEPYVKLPLNVTAVVAGRLRGHRARRLAVGDGRQPLQLAGLPRTTATTPSDGFVPFENVVGRAILISWPIDRWTLARQLRVRVHRRRRRGLSRDRVRSPTLRHERQLLRDGARLRDRLRRGGRGAIAGPVGVGLSVVHERTRSAPVGLRDSKLLTEPRREELQPAVAAWTPITRSAWRRNDEIETHRHHRRASVSPAARAIEALRASGCRDSGCRGAARRIARLADPGAATRRPRPRAARDHEGEGGPHLRGRRRGIRAGQGASRPAHDRVGRRAPRLPVAVEQGLRVGRALRRDRPHRPERRCTGGAGCGSRVCSICSGSTSRRVSSSRPRLVRMDEDEFEDYDREVELALYREYRDVVGQFTYVVETERRFYLANDVTLERHDTEHDFYFELTMNDVWVWDVYRCRPVREERAGADVQRRQRRGARRQGPRTSEGTRARRVAVGYFVLRSARHVRAAARTRAPPARSRCSGAQHGPKRRGRAPRISRLSSMRIATAVDGVLPCAVATPRSTFSMSPPSTSPPTAPARNTMPAKTGRGAGPDRAPGEAEQHEPDDDRRAARRQAAHW